MKQAVLYAPNDLRVETVEVPSLEPGDVLVKVTAALLCGTDVRIYTGRETKNVSLPSGPLSVSLPALPVRVSLPAPPFRILAAPLPVVVLARVFPMPLTWRRSRRAKATPLH